MLFSRIHFVGSASETAIGSRDIEQLKFGLTRTTSMHLLKL